MSGGGEEVEKRGEKARGEERSGEERGKREEGRRVERRGGKRGTGLERCVRVGPDEEGKRRKRDVSSI